MTALERYMDISESVEKELSTLMAEEYGSFQSYGREVHAHADTSSLLGEHSFTAVTGS